MSETLLRLVEPLKAEMAELDTQIVKLTVELGKAREARRNIEFVLKRLDPSSVEKKKAGRPADRVSRAPDVLAFLESHENGDDFGYTAVFKAMKAEGARIGKDKVRAAFDELHAQGILRMTRTTSGGGKAYTLVGNA
jgi:hypothetical protein